jgi:hypothetical protein
VVWKDEMTTTQGPQHWKATRAAPRRYPIPLQLHYKATSELGPLYGFSQIRAISSKYIVFAPGDGLKPGMVAEIAVAWPDLLDGRIPLQLMLEATITSSQDGVVEARIYAYDFRTRRSTEVERSRESHPKIVGDIHRYQGSSLLEKFLCSVGRRKFLKPLYAELLKTPEDSDLARNIYRRARPGYHFIARNTLDAMMGTQFNGA